MLGRSFLKWGEINRPATPIHWCWFWRNTGVSLSHAPFLFSASCALPNTFDLWPRSSRTPSLQPKIPGLLTVSHSAPSLAPQRPGPHLLGASDKGAERAARARCAWGSRRCPPPAEAPGPDFFPRDPGQTRKWVPGRPG